MTPFEIKAELIKVLKSSAYPEELRIAAAAALGRVRSSDSLDALSAVMKSSAYPVSIRAEAAKSLGLLIGN